MTVDQTNELSRVLELYESLFKLMNEHEPQTIILDSINSQLRGFIDQMELLLGQSLPD